MRAFRVSALLIALVMPSMAMPEIRQGGTQGWELRSVSLSELSKLGLATGPSNRRPIFQNLDGGPPRGHHGGPPPGFQQVQLLGGGPGPRGPRAFPGANIPLDNLFASAQIHRRPQAPPQLGPPTGSDAPPNLNGLRLPPGWQAIQIDANQFSSITSGKPVNIPGLGGGAVQIDAPQQHFNQGGLQGPQNIQVIQGGPPQGPPPGAQVLQLPNNKLEIPQNTPTFQHGPFRFAHVSEEVQLIGQNGQKTIEVPVGTGHEQIKQVVQQQSEPQSNTVPAAEGGNIIPGGLPAAIQQFLKDNTPQFQLQDEEEGKEQQAQLQGHQAGHQEAQQVAASPQHVQQHQVVHQQPQHQLQQTPVQVPVHFQQQVHQQLPVPQALVQPAGPPGEAGPIGNIPPGWKVIRVTADQLAAYQRGGPAPWLANANQNVQQHQQHHQHQVQQHHQQQQQQHQIQEQHQGPPQHIEAPQNPHHQIQHEQRGNFEASGPSGHHGFHGGHQGHAPQGPSESFQPQNQAAPPVRIPPRANVKVVYLPLSGNVKSAQHQQPLYREERREHPRHQQQQQQQQHHQQQQQDWQPPAIEHGAWKAITPNYVQQNSNGPWNKPSASNGGQAYATSERYHQRGNHIEEHRHEHPPNNHHHGNHGSHNNGHHGNQEHGGQRARGVVTRENAQKWFS